MKTDRLIMGIAWVLVLGFLLIVLFPFYWMVNTSLKPLEEVFLSPPTFWSPNWTLDPYISMWNTKPIGRWFINSFIISSGSTLIAMVLSALAAYGFSRFRIKGEQRIILILLFTQMLPGTLLIIPYFQMMSDLGLINNYIAVILAYVSFSLPFSTWILIGFFRSIPRDLDEAAMVDGCSRLGSFWRVVLPLSVPGLVAVTIFTFLTAWNAYVFALVLTTKTEMFPVSVGIPSMVGEYKVLWNELMAASVLAILPVLILYAFLEKYLVQGITAGAIKG